MLLNTNINSVFENSTKTIKRIESIYLAPQSVEIKTRELKRLKVMKSGTLSIKSAHNQPIPVEISRSLYKLQVLAPGNPKIRLENDALSLFSPIPKHSSSSKFIMAAE